MCGIGTTLVEAVHQGRDATGMEYEARFAQMAAANLLAGLTEFFNREVFGPHRRERLSALLARLDDTHLHEHQERLVTVQRQIAELKTRKERVLDSLEAADEPTAAFVNSINERTARIGADLEAKQAALRELLDATPAAPCPDLLDHFPTGGVELDLLPEPPLRRLLDAFAVQMRHDKEGNRVDVQVTITPETADTQLKAANAVVTGDAVGRDDDHAAMRVVYPLRDPPQTGSSPHPTQRPPNHPIPLPDPVTMCRRSD